MNMKINLVQHNKIIQIIKHKNTSTKNNPKQQNYPGLVASYNNRPGNG